MDSINNTSNTSGQQQGGEKQDWLDKGIESAGEKAGVNIVRLLQSHTMISLVD